MGSTGKTTVQHYITGLSLFLSPYHFLLAIDTATFTAPSLPAFQPFFIHSLQSTHNEPPVIIHSLLRVAVLSLFSIQFIGIYLRLINRGFHLRYVSFLFFSLKSGCAAVLFARHKSRFYPITLSRPFTNIVTEFSLHLKHAG